MCDDVLIVLVYLFASTFFAAGFFHRLYKNTKAALTKFIGYHLLELLLYIALFFPSFVPWINRLYDIAWLSWTRERIDRSDEIFNFDCLFKQVR